MWRKRKKREKKPAVILRLVWRFGYKPGRVMREVLEWIEVFAVAGAMAALIMTFVTVRMHVPTGSMIPTIGKGHSFFVDRITYYFRDPKPGNIVVFRHPRALLVRKIEAGSQAEEAGMKPGETIAEGTRAAYIGRTSIYTGSNLIDAIAAVPSGEPILLTTLEGNAYNLGVKSEDQSTLEDLGISIREKHMLYVKRLIAIEGQTIQIRGGDLYVDGERLEGELFERPYYSNSFQYQYGVEPTVVPEDHYFMLGDNSANSFDSRFWGFVDDKDIVGVPYLRVWPLTHFGAM